MILIYIPLHTSNTSTHNSVFLFLVLSTPISLLTIGLLCNTPTSPSNYFAHSLYPNPNNKPLLPLFFFQNLFFFFFSLFIFFFVFFSSSSAPFDDPSFLLYFLHLSFHTDHTVDFSAQILTQTHQKQLHQQKPTKTS
jgi:hypothetical protein